MVKRDFKLIANRHTQTNAHSRSGRVQARVDPSDDKGICLSECRERWFMLEEHVQTKRNERRPNANTKDIINCREKKKLNQESQTKPVITLTNVPRWQQTKSIDANLFPQMNQLFMFWRKKNEQLTDTRRRFGLIKGRFWPFILWYRPQALHK